MDLDRDKGERGDLGLGFWLWFLVLAALVVALILWVQP